MPFLSPVQLSVEVQGSVFPLECVGQQAGCGTESQSPQSRRSIPRSVIWNFNLIGQGVAIERSGLKYQQGVVTHRDGAWTEDEQQERSETPEGISAHSDSGVGVPHCRQGRDHRTPPPRADSSVFMSSRESAPPFTWTAVQGPESLALAWKPPFVFFFRTPMTFKDRQDSRVG